MQPINRRVALAGLTGLAALALAPRAKADLAFRAAAEYSAARRGVSFLVMQGGEILFEDYPGGGGHARGFELASGTKSFCGLMVAAAVADGLLRLDEPCAEALPEWRGDPRRDITLRHLLTLTSGLEGGGVGRPPPYAQAIQTRTAHAPGGRFAYGPAPFQIFGELLKRKLAAAGKPADPIAYLQARVLDPAGCRPSAWRKGPDGNPLLPQGAAFTARDWARFGQFVLDGAPGADPQALAACFEGTRANPGYGLSWWLLRPGLIGPAPRAGVNEATTGGFEGEDVVMAAGAGNQRLYLLRKRKLVVVRQADGILQSLSGRGPDWSDRMLLERLLG